VAEGRGGGSGAEGPRAAEAKKGGSRGAIEELPLIGDLWGALNLGCREEISQLWISVEQIIEPEATKQLEQIEGT
jgi:hypothetical protein